jgi:hypothetical protein
MGEIGIESRASARVQQRPGHREHFKLPPAYCEAIAIFLRIIRINASQA